MHVPPPTVPLLRHRSQFGFGFPLTVPGGVFSYGTYYDPSHATYPDPKVYVDRHYPPLFAEPNTVTGSIPAGVNPVVVYRPGCDSQTVTFPSEDGGERSINILRC